MLLQVYFVLIDRMSAELFRNEISNASSQHIPEACDEARNIEYELGSGCTTAPKILFIKLKHL